MQVNRHVHLKADEDCDLAALSGGEFNAAIGYAVLWAAHSERYRHLNLFIDKRGDIHAGYENKDGEPTYAMFGQRAEDGTYSFHS